MPANTDPLEPWPHQQAPPLAPPPGTFELITRRARRRRLRRAAAAVVAAAAVAASVAVATVSPSLLRVTAPPESERMTAGDTAQTGALSPPTTPRPNGSARLFPFPPPGSSSAGARQPFPGPVPPDFAPLSVTFVSLARAWVIGQAGRRGSCYNGTICTSVAWTSDDGGTWHGEHAPVTGAPSGPQGVGGIRFLDGVNGWAFGPELWSTHDAGNTWRAVGTSGLRVTGLETAGNRAYALFARCSGTSETDCADYTLMSAPAGSDAWTPVGPATTGLAGGGSPALALAGGAGFLLAPDGAVYSGTVSPAGGGGEWVRVGTAPCRRASPSADPPAGPRTSGLPPAGLLASYGTDLAMTCGDSPAVWRSADSGAHWTRSPGAPFPGPAASLAAAPDGTLLLAAAEGIVVLPPGAAAWRAATATSGRPLPDGGFGYVGMTSDSRGAALPVNAALHQIWVTADGGRTWTPRSVG